MYAPFQVEDRHSKFCINNKNSIILLSFVSFSVPESEPDCAIVQPAMVDSHYSSKGEAERICDLILTLAPLPKEIEDKRNNVTFESSRDFPYFPIPLKQTEVASALKAIEGCLASAVADLKHGSHQERRITVNLEKATAFLFQAYQATVGGHGKLDSEVKKYLKGV